jgi:hypothetical protein
MKTRVQRFSPHQNAKVLAVLMAVTSLVFLVPFMLFANAMSPQGFGFPGFMVLLFPVMYLVIGYVSVVIGCWVYNLLARFTGGIEFEAQSMEA